MKTKTKTGTETETETNNSSSTELAIVKVEPKDVKIPATKLGFKQQEKYEEYGMQTISDIESMAKEIQRAKEDEYLNKNREKVEDEIIRENPAIVAKLASIKVKAAKIKELTVMKGKEMVRLSAVITKLENKIELNNASYNEKISDALEKLSPDCEDFRSLEIDGINPINLSVSLGNDEQITTNLEFKDLIDGSYVEDKLKADFKESQKTLFMMREQIKDMRDNFKEVLLFNDERLEEMFRNLLELKNKMKADYRKMKLE